MPKNTSWNSVAGWYDDLLETSGDTYQEKVILPNLLRILDIKKGDKILDLGCGQGFFAQHLAKMGVIVTGVDISVDLIEIAKKKSQKDVNFFVGSAENLSFLKSNSFDAIVLILAIQNMEDITAVFRECRRVLHPQGKLIIVMSHPVVRAPQKSSWGWDDKKQIQYRRLDGYLSEFKAKIIMHPSQKDSPTTTTFHRPLQVYFKALAKNNFAVTRLEEWISHKKSQKGPRAKAEDESRKEFPLFLCLEATSIDHKI